MKISVVSGVGQAETLLSSFDDALQKCGVYNYNIIALSSVIPPKSEVIVQEFYTSPPKEYGHRLYVVKADMRSAEAGKVIAAGVAWYQWGDNRGVFVEHETIGSTSHGVEEEMDFRMTHSIKDLCTFRGIPFEESKMGKKVSIAQVKDHPTSVLVLAVYKAERW